MQAKKSSSKASTKGGSKLNAKPTWNASKTDRLGNSKKEPTMSNAPATAAKAATNATDKPVVAKSANDDKAATEKKTKEKSSAEKAARKTLSSLFEKKIKILVTENPKREGTRAYERFAGYKDGLTVKEYVEKGGAMSAVRYDSAHNYIELQ